MTTHQESLAEAGQAAASISRTLTREVLSFDFDQIPASVVEEAKRRVLDTLACAAGGVNTPPSVIVRRFIEQVGGRPEATVFGSGLRTSCANAALANGVMVRSTEAMDRGLMSRGGTTQHAHPGEIIPPIIAVAERARSSGRDVIAAIVIGYQLLNRVSEAMGGARASSELGWKPEIKAGLVVPMVLGKLMGLSEGEIVNATGISASYAGELGVMDSPVEGRTMAREMKFPFAAYQAILFTQLASMGFDGPARVVEGDQGFAEVLCRGRIDLARLTRREDDYSISYTQTKMYPVNGRLQAQTEALLRMVTTHDLRADDIERITIWTTRHVVERLADRRSHLYPATKATADHSAYYVAALAVVDRALHLDMSQFDESRLADPRLRAVIDKVSFVTVPEWVDDQAPTKVEIRLKNGDAYRDEVGYAKGHVMNPITDADIDRKFQAMASRNMSPDRAANAIETIRRLDRMSDIGELARAMVAS